MVGIKDMHMPSCCMNCGLLGKEEMYCSIYPRKDLDIITVATRPNWCPLIETDERKVGKWIEVKSTEYKEFSVTDMKCNCCNRYASLVLPHGTTCTYDVCPNCGAKME